MSRKPVHPVVIVALLLGLASACSRPESEPGEVAPDSTTESAMSRPSPDAAKAERIGAPAPRATALRTATFALG